MRVVKWFIIILVMGTVGMVVGWCVMIVIMEVPFWTLIVTLMAVEIVLFRLGAWWIEGQD